MFHSDNKSVKIADILRKRLLSSNSDSSQEVWTARKLAEEFAVSHQTVNRALQMLAGENLLERRQGLGSRQRAKVRPKIAVCPGGMLKPRAFLEYSTFPQRGEWLMAALNQANCDYQIFNYTDLQKNFFSSRIFNRFDGLLMSTDFMDWDSRQLFSEFAKPKVWICNNQLAGDNSNQVVPDLQGGFVELFRRAKREGIKECILHCSREFFAKIMSNAAFLCGYKTQEVSILHYSSNMAQLEAYKYALKAPVSNQLLHACDMDTIALGMYEAFRDRDLQFGDFHISGNGDIEGSGFLPLGEAHLTSIDSFRQQQMQTVVDLLMSRLQNNSKPSEIVCTPCHLVIRDSAFFSKKTQKTVKK